MSTLRIRFDGLCAFVSNTAKNDDNGGTKYQDNEMEILLVDSQHHASMKHLPRFSYSAQNLLKKRDAQQTNPWDLKEEHLEISIVSPNGQEERLPRGSLQIIRDRRLYFLDTQEPVNAFPIHEEEISDFGWIPSMRQIDPSFKLNKELLDKSVRSGLIAGRLNVTAGTIKVHSLVREHDNVSALAAFGFRNGKGTIGTFRQALAESVVAEVDIPDGSNVKFTSYSLADPMQEKQWVILQPDDDGNIETAFTNLPEETVGIEHFAMFFQLNEGSLPSHPPIPYRCSIRGNGHQNGNGQSPEKPPAQGNSPHSHHEHPLKPLYHANPDACPIVQYP